MFHVEYRQRQIVMRTVENLSAKLETVDGALRNKLYRYALLLLVFLLLVFMQKTSKICLLENFQDVKNAVFSLFKYGCTVERSEVEL